MILGLSPEGFLLLHVLISMVGIFAGFIVLGGMYASNKLPFWTAIFLLTTFLTSVTGFLFPITVVTPALGFGILSVILLTAAAVGYYIYGLAGRWRVIYVVTAVTSLYLNVFVFVVQSFQKVTFLQHLAPTQGEPPFLISQSVLLATFIALGAIATWTFHPERRRQPAFAT